MLSGIVVVDKPQGITSHDAVSRLRSILNERRIGHGGTLDPLATGVLPVFVGRATRASSFMLDSDKSYTASFRLGIVTDTQDITGKVLSNSNELPAQRELIDILGRFTGKLRQTPPMYSSLKIGGKKLYELARSGIEVERQPRDIEIYSILLHEEKSAPSEGLYTVSVSCSKGTYIRTLIHDIGQLLGCGAVLTALRRTSAGPFDLSMSKTLEELERAKSAGTVESLILPTDIMFSGFPEIRLDTEGERLCRNGALVPLRPAEARSGDSGLFRVYGPEGDFLMVGKIVRQNGIGLLKTVKSFFEV
jgi:tRNA pseudouridine55 synthase